MRHGLLQCIIIRKLSQPIVLHILFCILYVVPFLVIKVDGAFCSVKFGAPLTIGQVDATRAACFILYTLVDSSMFL